MKKITIKLTFLNLILIVLLLLVTTIVVVNATTDSAAATATATSSSLLDTSTDDNNHDPVETIVEADQQVATVEVQNWAVVLLDYDPSTAATNNADDESSSSNNNNANADRLSATTMYELIFTHPNSPISYLHTASYGQLHIHGHIVGNDWIEIQPDDIENSLFGEGWTACWPIDSKRFEYVIEADPTINLTMFDGYLYVVRRSSDVSLGCSAGVANGYGPLLRNTYTFQGDITTRVVYVSGNDFYNPNILEYSRYVLL